MGYEVPSEKLLGAMGGNDWSGLIGGRDASVKGGTPLKQIAGPLGKPCLVVLRVVPETLRYDRDKGPAAFVDGNQVTLVSIEGDGLALDAKRGGISGAVHAILGGPEFKAPAKEVHEVLDRKGGDMLLNDLVGANAMGKITGMRTVFAEAPLSFVVYDARGRGNGPFSLEDGETCPLRRLHVMMYPSQGLVVTCGNLAGGADTVTVDTFASASQATKRITEIVEKVSVREANEAQEKWDADTVRIGGARGIKLHFDVRTVVEILGASLFLIAIFGYTYLNHLEEKPEWLEFLLNSNGAAAVAVVVVLAVYVAFSGMLRNKDED